MTQTIVNLGTGGAVLNGQNGSTAGADSNDALFLDWDGESYMYLPGGSFNFLSIPDEAALDITSDLDVRMYLAPDSWNDASFLSFIAKSTSTGNQRSWILYANSGTANLRFVHYSDGSTAKDAVSTAAVPFADGQPGWIRVTLDVNNGASGHDVKFFTSSDGIAWTQLGSTITTAGSTSIFNSTAPLTIMNHAGQGSSKAGNVYRAQVFNGIDGTKALDVDTSVITTGAATSFIALTGQTVTITRSTSGRKAVAVVAPVWLFGTDDYMEVADNALLDFGASDSFTVVAVDRTWATPASSQRIIDKASSSATSGYSLLHSGTSTATAGYIHDGTNTAASTGAAPASGLLTVSVFVVNRTSQTITHYMNGTAATPDSTTSVGSLANAYSLRVGSIGETVGTYADMELLAVAVFRRALTATEIGLTTAYYQERLS